MQKPENDLPFQIYFCTDTFYVFGKTPIASYIPRVFFKYNGFVVIMNSNHVFDIKVRPIEELKFVSMSKKAMSQTERAHFVYTELLSNFIRNFIFFVYPMPFILLFYSFTLALVWWLHPIKYGRKLKLPLKIPKKSTDGNHNNCSVNLWARVKSTDFSLFEIFKLCTFIWCCSCREWFCLQ